MLGKTKGETFNSLLDVNQTTSTRDIGEMNIL